MCASFLCPFPEKEPFGCPFPQDVVLSTGKQRRIHDGSRLCHSSRIQGRKIPAQVHGFRARADDDGPGAHPHRRRLARRERLENEVLHIAYALLSDGYKALPYFSRFDADDLLVWRVYAEADCSGKVAAALTRRSESKVSRIKARVGEIIVRIAEERLAAE